MVVFVPNDPNGALTPIKQGTDTCNTCDVSIGDYVTATISGPDGKFTLTGVPATTHVPLVVQIGKWRREVFLSQVTGCTDNAIAGLVDDAPPREAIRGGHSADGPRHRRRGQPRAASSRASGSTRASTRRPTRAGGSTSTRGWAVAGAAASWGGRRRGAPGLSSGGTAGDCTTDNPDLRLELEGQPRGVRHRPPGLRGRHVRSRGVQQSTTNKTTTSKQALHDWLDEGGKVFATHFHYTWFKNGPADFQGVATWLGHSGGQDNALYTIDTSFPKGMVFNQWLGNVGALSGSQINLTSVAESVSTVNAPTQRWIYNPAQDPQQRA